MENRMIKLPMHYLVIEMVASFRIINMVMNMTEKKKEKLQTFQIYQINYHLLFYLCLSPSHLIHFLFPF